jgi:upstream activation factor subunit UAF30
MAKITMKKAVVKTTAKKAAPAKATLKKAVVKTTAKKAAPAKATAKKVVAKTTAKKAAPAKATLKKAVAKTTAKKAAPVKATLKKVVIKTTAKKTVETKKKAVRTPNAAFMKPLNPSKELAEIVGATALPRTEVMKKVWAYIKKNNLQDTKNRRAINADDKLKAVFGGKKQVTMFEMTKLVSNHLN